MVCKKLDVEGLIEILKGYPQKMQVCGTMWTYDNTWYTTEVSVEVINRNALKDDEIEDADVSRFDAEFLSIL